MKKIIGIVFVSLMFCNIGYAEMTLMEEEKLGDYTISTVCIDGYKFVSFDRVAKEGISMVQFMRQNKAHGTAYPVKC